MQVWLNSNLNGTLANGICHEAASTNGQNGDVIEVDPWACSINEQSQNDDDLKPSQSKLRKLLSEHQVCVHNFYYEGRPKSNCRVFFSEVRVPL